MPVFHNAKEDPVALHHVEKILHGIVSSLEELALSFRQHSLERSYVVLDLMNAIQKVSEILKRLYETYPENTNLIEDIELLDSHLKPALYRGFELHEILSKEAHGSTSDLTLLTCLVDDLVQALSIKETSEWDRIHHEIYTHHIEPEHKLINSQDFRHMLEDLCNERISNLYHSVSGKARQYESEIKRLTNEVACLRMRLQESETGIQKKELETKIQIETALMSSNSMGKLKQTLDSGKQIQNSVNNNNKNDCDTSFLPSGNNQLSLLNQQLIEERQRNKQLEVSSEVYKDEQKKLREILVCMEQQTQAVKTQVLMERQQSKEILQEKDKMIQRLQQKLFEQTSDCLKLLRKTNADDATLSFTPWDNTLNIPFIQCMHSVNGEEKSDLDAKVENLCRQLTTDIIIPNSTLKQ